MKLLYRPVGLIAGVLAGFAAGAVFKRAWRVLAREEDTPDAKDKFRSWPEVISAAALQGAVFGGTKAVVDRAAATGFEQLTGVWPGKTRERRGRKGTGARVRHRGRRLRRQSV
jgi:hypothetical protein